MKLILVATTLAIAGATASYLAPSPQQNPGVDTMTTAAIGNPSSYSVSNIAEGKACVIKRGKPASTRTFALKSEPGCDDVWPGLDQARNWTENADGSVALTDKAGRQVIMIAPGDGIGYVAVDPPSAALTLTAVR
ncbi:hypothetical protein [Rhizobium sp. C1]|uniref:hypothetical protein n=1 Tax=Rhizobium sp. C1 TaxID=1349799 RepID=UPI001E4DC36F|nr:hypothetical protein [Rhizobium sp. C1]MCD2180037.1 hypothetical protein [Rhizobium sp. C1]